MSYLATLPSDHMASEPVLHRSAKEPAATLPTPTQVPMPDLNSQPLDPDEPTYCLCNQVSFGEMIGCDNEEVRLYGADLQFNTPKASRVVCGL